MRESYYIGGKRYAPEESTLLCEVDGARLYQTRKGAFFSVVKHEMMETAVTLLDRAVAMAFMDEHPAGIITENYDRVFGEPEPG